MSLFNRESLRERMGGGAWSGFRASRKKNTYNDNMRMSYFTGGNSRSLMFDEEDNQTEVIGDVFGKKRRGSIFGQDLGNMFGN